MTAARTKLKASIAKMTDDQIESVLVMLNKHWDAYTIEERAVRAELLNEYETRNGGEMVDALMDKLEEMAVSQ